MTSSFRRKAHTPPRPSATDRVLPSSASSKSGFALLAEALRPQLRALRLSTVLTVAPLGAFLGTVVACGAAAPVQPTEQEGNDAGAGGLAPSVPTVAPSSASSAAPDAGSDGSPDAAPAESDADVGAGATGDADTGATPNGEPR